jgi:hypothetical protein
VLAGETTELGHLGASGLTLTLGPMLLVALLVARPVARRCGTSAVVAACAIGSVGLVLALTLGARAIDGVREPAVAWTPWFGDAVMRRRILTPDPDWMLNVALFVPAGASLTALTRRAGLVVVALLGLSIGVEVLQRLTEVGLPDPADVVANTIGAALGAGLAVASDRTRAGGNTKRSSRVEELARARDAP